MDFLICRMCDYKEELINGVAMCDYTNEGWFCEDCDSFNYFNEENHQNHKFTVILEDKMLKESKEIAVSKRKFKKQLSPFRYPRREK